MHSPSFANLDFEIVWLLLTFLTVSKDSFADSNHVSRELSLHPVHLTPDEEGNLPPSALIPFSSYQGEFSVLGRELPELDNITVCDKFQSTILEGQLCYTLNIAKLTVNIAHCTVHGAG